jgi:hypothetical protein
MVRQQRFDFGAQLRVVAALTLDERSARGLRQFDRAEEEAFRALM